MFDLHLPPKPAIIRPAPKQLLRAGVEYRALGGAMPGVVGAGAAAVAKRKVLPTEFANLEVWLDAADAATITNAGAGAVSAWASKDPGSRVFAQGTAGNRPTTGTVTQNGKNVLAFDGADYVASTLAASTWNFLHNANGSTVIIVFSHTGNDAVNRVMGTARTSSAVGYAINVRDDAANIAKIEHEVFRGVGGATTVGNTSANDFFPASSMGCLLILSDPNNGTAANRSEMRRNGGAAVKNNATANAPSASNATETLAIGITPPLTTNNLIGNIAEVIVYSRVLPSNEWTPLVSSVVANWGLS